ncbi:MAG: hypothetical protein N2449_06210 [Bacteroidales bacterium]|nr:hypothetical protein [Bacteroidales bacterium]
MHKSNILIIVILFSINLLGQEENVFEPKLVREITPDKKIESYIEIRDSVLAFIDVFKEKWGQEEDTDGKIRWTNVAIDSIDGKIELQLYHPKSKSRANFPKTTPIAKKTKGNEIRVIRLRFIQKNKDILSSQQNARYIIDYIKQLYTEIAESDEESDE